MSLLKARMTYVAVSGQTKGLGLSLEAVGLGVADEVHPVAGVLFAEVGAGEKAIDDFLVGVGRLVVQEVF
ncbi:MAG: hypothetical protein U0793_07980 [Gemmataceae bacterium]